MQKRLYVVFNFIAFNLLFFALYLNFIHKDTRATLPTLPQSTSVEIHVPAATQPAAKDKAPKENVNKKTSAVDKQSEVLKLSIY